MSKESFFRENLAHNKPLHNRWIQVPWLVTVFSFKHPVSVPYFESKPFKKSAAFRMDPLYQSHRLCLCEVLGIKPRASHILASALSLSHVLIPSLVFKTKPCSIFRWPVGLCHSVLSYSCLCRVKDLYSTSASERGTVTLILTGWLKAHPNLK
jgi:hypothetical protein